MMRTAPLLAFLLAQSSPGALGPESPETFIERARQATVRYQDQAFAIQDGYRRIGRDFPAMGEHWIKIGLLFDGEFDARHPEILTYAAVSGRPQLLGVAYAAPLLQGESAPDAPVGKEAWHDHFRTIHDETFLPQHHTPGHGDHGPRLAMLHAWIWSTNPEGTFAADNWNIPYIQLGIKPPNDAPAAAARALSLATVSTEYFLVAADAAASLTSSEHSALEKALARSRGVVQKLLRDRKEAELSSSELKELANVWNQLWIAVDVSVRPQTRARLQQLSLRKVD
jgi:hypothetical protein